MAPNAVGKTCSPRPLASQGASIVIQGANVRHKGSEAAHTAKSDVKAVTEEEIRVTIFGEVVETPHTSWRR